MANKYCETCKHKQKHNNEILHSGFVFQQGKIYSIYYCPVKNWNVADCNMACREYEKKKIKDVPVKQKSRP